MPLKEEVLKIFDKMGVFTLAQLDEKAKFDTERAMIAEREGKARAEAVMIGQKKRTAHSFGMRDTMDLPARPIENHESVTASVLRLRGNISTLIQLQGKSKQRWMELFGDC